MIIWLISGLWVLFGCAEAAHLLTIITNRSLQRYITLSSILIFAGLLLYGGIGVFLFMRTKRTVQKGTEASTLLIGVASVLAIASLCRLCSCYVPVFQEAVYEITLGNLKNGSLMTLHPFLGGVTEKTMPIRMQILGLSSLYSGLVTISQQSPYMIMCKIVPVCVWGLSVLLYWAFSEVLFQKETQKRLLFVCMIMLIYLATSGSEGMIGYRLFYAGFAGETIRGALLIPYTIYVSLQKKWHLTILAVLVEACLVWTTFGIGYCLLIGMCIFALQLWTDWRKKHANGVE